MAVPKSLQLIALSGATGSGPAGSRVTRGALLAGAVTGGFLLLGALFGGRR